MRSTALLLALSFHSTAFADKRVRISPIKQSSNAEAVAPPEGSLWDFIEEAEGEIPSDAQAQTATEELDQERISEEEFVQAISVHGRPDVGFYLDPVQTLAVDPLHLSEIDPNDFDIPVVINSDVQRWMGYFTGKGRSYFTKWLERKGQYEALFSATLTEAELPQDLMYLSMIESGYMTHAFSRAAAVGLWQFIAPTAKESGLRVDWWVDERRDPELATQAAARFLGRLYNRYDDWYLAWAAYNGGPGRVDRAIKKYGTRDFWTLVEKGAFPSETDNYVPKLIAAAIIGHYAERYGFTNIKPHDPLVYETVNVEPNIGMDILARCAGITTEEMQTLNPQLRRWALPPEPSTQILRVPLGSGEHFLAALAEVPASERLSFHEHKVSKGESLGQIANRYGVSVTDIQSVNRIENPNKILVGTRLVIPAPGGAKAMVSVAGSGTSTAKTKQITHVVRSGEVLSTIAERYGVKLADLMRWNNIDNVHLIQAGQKLKLYEPASQWNSYTVRSGDTLSTIAERNHCGVDELKSWNNLKSNRIFAGQKLKIRRS
jgi:membrane-bound lytic murein transglycosylase D